MPVEEAALRELAHADVLAFGPVGFAATLLPVTQAYERLAETAASGGIDVRPYLDRLLAEGSPAGRAYAATLLSRLDPDVGRSAWRSLATDTAELTTFEGCVMHRTTLAEYAGAHLDPARMGPPDN